MNGGELIAEVIKKQDIDFLFTLCGGHISPILVGAKKKNIRVIDVRNESTAVFAADAYARLTGKPGVAVVTAGPGVTNTITAIKNAQLAQVPIVLLGGAVATLLRGRGALQDIEQLEIFKTITKWSTRIEQDCDIVPIMEEAFEVAASGVPGPVFIECPIDILYDEELVKKWYSQKSGKPKNLTGKVINWYIKRHADKLFACSNKKHKISKSNSPELSSIYREELERAYKYLKKSEKPVIILGSQAVLRIENIPELIKALEKIKIPIYLTGMARGLLGSYHRLYFRHGRKDTLKQADLVIVAGMPMDFRLDYGRSINKKAILITLNRNKKDLRKNRAPTMGIQTDVSTFLINMSRLINDNSSDYSNWIGKIGANEEMREEKINEISNINTELINPLKFLKKTDALIHDNSIIVVDGGDFIATASYLIKPRDPLTWLDAGPYGTLGAGAGFALAAKLVHPEKEVWLFYGDGAAGYSISEFDSFIRHNISIIAVVGNDAGWTQITRDQVEYLGDDVGTILRYTDYHNVAKGFGAEGILIKNQESIETSLKKAKSLSKEGKPVLINVLIDKTEFRKGSISM